MHPVAHTLLPELLLDGSALARLPVDAIEGRREPLVARRARQQVAGELPGDELIPGQVGVEHADHPIAIRPRVGVAVGLIPIRVRVAGEIEPGHRHAFPETRRSEQSIDDRGVSRGRRIGEERVDFRRRRRQAGEIERDSSQPAFARCLGSGAEGFGFNPGEDETIEFAARPRGSLNDGRGHAVGQRHERPMGFVPRPACNPPAQRFLLRRGEDLVRLRRRHHFVVVGARDSQPGFRSLRRPRGDRPPVVALRGCAFEGVETQFSLSVGRIEPVTMIAILREDRANVAVETDLRGTRREREDESGSQGRRLQTGSSGSRTDHGGRRMGQFGRPITAARTSSASATPRSPAARPARSCPRWSRRRRRGTGTPVRAAASRPRRR